MSEREMTPEQKQQRIERIREQRAKEYGHSFTGTRGTDAMMADIDFLLSLVKSQEAGCSLCGGPHDFDTSIPSAVWNAVIRARELPDYLCTTCIVREFVRAEQSFTATLWNEEFYGVPIEVVVNGQNAKDTAAIQEENNSLWAELSASAEAIVNEAGKVSQLISNAATSMRSACAEKVSAARREHEQVSSESEDYEYHQAAAFALTCLQDELEKLTIGNTN